jgi:hypothetical protein
VTKRVETAESLWTGWNWRTEGDMMVNGAFFVPSGEGLETTYEKASSVEAKSAALVDMLTQNAGVLGERRYTLGLFVLPSRSPVPCALCLITSWVTIHPCTARGLTPVSSSGVGCAPLQTVTRF